VLAIGLPDLPFHLRLDNLAAVFVLLLGFAAAGISIFAAGYFRKGEGAAPGLMCLQYHVFLASMLLVLLADDAYAFMVAWEGMALSSFFLVTTDHRHAEIRRAGYPLSADRPHRRHRHPALLRRDDRRQRRLQLRRHARAATVAVLGFGRLPAGAGRLRRQGRPAAGARLAAGGAPGGALAGVGDDERRHAEDGHLRPAARLLRPGRRAALVVGRGGHGRRPATAVFGVLYSTVQSDMKRLLAYSSIENIGLLAVALGLTLIFHAYGWRRWRRWP
jgi:hydrogenase-4 component B